MTDYPLVLTMNYPGSEWSMNDETYESLVWYSGTAKPTKEELDALYEATRVENEKNKKDALRKAAYQETSDPLFFKWQSGEGTKEEWLAARGSVKESFPST